MRYLRVNLSRKVGRLVEWSGGFRERRYSAEPVLDDTALVGRPRYDESSDEYRSRGERHEGAMVPDLTTVLLMSAANAAICYGLFKLVPKGSRRLSLRSVAAAVGGGLGCAVAYGEILLLLALAKPWGEAGIAYLLLFPKLVPVASGMLAWLMGESVGGLSARPTRAAIGACLGGLCAALTVYFESDAAWRMMPLTAALTSTAGYLLLRGAPLRPMHQNDAMTRPTSSQM